MSGRRKTILIDLEDILQSMTTYILIAGLIICIIGILDYRTRRLQKEESITKAQIVGVYECIEKIQEFISEQNKINFKSLGTVKSVIEQTKEISDTLKKTLLAIYVLKLGSQLCIANTVTKVLSDPKLLTPREASILLLDNLRIEYAGVTKQLKDQLLLLEDTLEKEKVQKMITEYENTISLISTISEESSDSYLEQIYVEVASSMKKVRDMGI
jgi:hypothetical protein